MRFSWNRIQNTFLRRLQMRCKSHFCKTRLRQDVSCRANRKHRQHQIREDRRDWRGIIHTAVSAAIKRTGGKKPSFVRPALQRDGTIISIIWKARWRDCVSQFLEAQACEIPDTCVVAVATNEGRLFVVGHTDLIGSPAEHQCEQSVLRE